MAAEWTAVMTDALTQAWSFIGDFGPVLYVVAGIALGIWILFAVRDYFTGAG